MTSRSLEKASALACNLFMTGLFLALVAAYGLLFNVFRSGDPGPAVIQPDQQAENDLDRNWPSDEPGS